MKLEVKVVLLTILILLVLGTAASGILLYYQRQHAIAQFQETAEAITASMQRSLEQWMLTGDRASVQDAVVSTSGADFIREATVYTPEGQIAASSDLAKIGKIDAENYLTAVLKGGSRTSHEIPGDSQGLLTISPVENEPACQRCHDQQQKVLGAIAITVDTSTLSDHLRTETILIASAGLITFILLGGSISLMLKRTVLNRVSSLQKTAQTISTGNYAARSEIQGKDEIGQLSSIFNEMASSVERHSLALQQSHQQLAELNASLEEKVKLRTKELSEVNALREQLLQKLISAQEEERRRIARELHDDASQSLAALAINLESEADVVPDDNLEMRQRLDTLQQRVVTTLASIRSLAVELRPSALDDLGLLAAIDWYAKDLLKKQKLDIKVQITGQKTKLPSYTETMLFRIVQEALTNIVKHAQAKRVSVELKFTSTEVVLRIQDNGNGFDCKAVAAAEGLRQNLGIHGMSERASLLGGELKVMSQPGQGTTVLVSVPLGRKNE